MIEHMQQDQRDNLMRQAQMQAAQATSTLTQALSSVPPGAMAQYPHLCGGLGHVSHIYMCVCVCIFVRL